MNIIIKKIFSHLCLSLLLLITFQPAIAEQFVIQDIRIEGLQRIKAGTVLNALPVKEGEAISEANTPEIIHTLYNTGFFEHVELGKKGNTLIIKVTERPTIANVNISGNKDLPTERLNVALKQMGLYRGEIFQKNVLTQLEQELRREYTGRGKYNAEITSSVVTLPQNRVDINLVFSEGRPAKVKEIKIIGNTAFSQNTLLKELPLSTAGLFDFFTKKSQYSKEKLDASLEALRSYYLDHGYIRFQIESTNVSLSPDKKEVFILIKIEEGPKYYFDGYDLTGILILPKEELMKQVKIKAGAVFSRKTVTDSAQQLVEAYGEQGYGFPTIHPEPTINEETKRVFITFYINPGQQVYVRRIHFKGNHKTADYVLRHGIRQPEGGLLSLKNVRESERQLRLLNYIQNVQVQTHPVPGTNNQIDLDYNITEGPTAEAKAMLGYGTQGPEFNVSLNQYNFLGTGRTIGTSFTINKLFRNITLSYYNPLYTETGIGRGFSVFYQKYTPGNFSLSNYATDRFGGNMYFNIPISDRNSLQLGAGYENVHILTNDKSPRQVRAFIAQNGNKFNQIRLTGGWTYNNLDQLPFPTKGFNHQVTTQAILPADSNSLSFYKLDYAAGYYQPLIQDFILWLSGNIGYGNQFNNNGLPFYENYFAGGIIRPGQIRGWENYFVGPRDSNNRPLGGNFLINGSVALILPYPLSRETMRSSIFFDAGNVYSYDLPLAQQGSPSGPVRYSTGIALDWRSPFGPLTFSLAKPLNPQPSDKGNIQYFQFSVMSSTATL